jgi:hypothetical protein
MGSEFIYQNLKNILDKYDKQNKKYLKYIMCNDITFNESNEMITFNIDEHNDFYFELLSSFDFQNNIWIWSWLLTSLERKQNKLSRGLLNYGLDLEPSSNSDEHYMIKSLLVNSRILIEDYIQLEINLAISSYLLRDRLLFIYPRKIYIDESKKKYVTNYYLIKKNI